MKNKYLTITFSNTIPKKVQVLYLCPPYILHFSTLYLPPFNFLFFISWAIVDNSSVETPRLNTS